MSATTPVAVLAELAGLSRTELGSSELSNEWRIGLLDPRAWHPVLETFASTANMAVALTDAKGRLLGEYHNPQRTWLVAHVAEANREGACPFCLAPAIPCLAVADALKAGVPVVAQDRLRLTHIAVPLFLNGKSLGALLFGQVFNQYPDPLVLQRAARELGVSSQQLWETAIHERPVSRATLQIYAKLLMILGNAFVGDCYATLLHGKLAEAHQIIRQSLGEKEALLREIQHRVKNNLAIMASLFSLQSDKLDDVDDAKTIAVLKASQQRLEAMAYIHDLLYRMDEIGKVNLSVYIKDLAQALIGSFQIDPGRITVRFNLAQLVGVSVRQAISCGLIVNELITNVFKYAYSVSDRGEIYIEVKSTEDYRVSFTIADQGCGIPEGVDWRCSQSMGMQIISTLIKQLDGTLELDTRHGVSFRLLFPCAVSR